VRDAEESIVLTDREREALAALAASTGDPWLAGQLTGQGRVPARPTHRPAWLASVRDVASGWIGVLLFVAGAALAITTFIHSTVVASLGLVVMGVGLWRFVADRGDGIVRRLAARQGGPASRRAVG
jgi:hypothetical protein